MHPGSGNFHRTIIFAAIVGDNSNLVVGDNTNNGGTNYFLTSTVIAADNLPP